MTNGKDECPRHPFQPGGSARRPTSAGVTLRRYEGRTLIELCDAFWDARKTRDVLFFRFVSAAFRWFRRALLNRTLAWHVKIQTADFPEGRQP
jgi:hypothetical protein